MPSLSDALANVDVIDSIQQAWEHTRQENIEYGGWIYYIPNLNLYRVKQTTDRSQSTITLTRLGDLNWMTSQNYTIIADFHCHPGNYVGAGRPSGADISGARALHYDRLVFTPDSNARFEDNLYSRVLARPVPFLLQNERFGVIMWQIR